MQIPDIFTQKSYYNSNQVIKRTGLAESNKHLTPDEWNSITDDLLRLSAQIESFKKDKNTE